MNTNIDVNRQIEILTNVNNAIKVEEFFRRGICDIVYHFSLIEEITEFEYESIISLLKKNKPKLNNSYSEFMDSDLWQNQSYWWQTMYSGQARVIRKQYLTKLIYNLSNNII